MAALVPAAPVAAPAQDVHPVGVPIPDLVKPPNPTKLPDQAELKKGRVRYK